MTLFWSEAAIGNLEEQLNFILQDKPSAAYRMAEEIDRQTRLLIDFPEMGRPGRVSGTRELIVSRTPYVAIYRLRNNTVEILRLLHMAQLWP